MAMICATSYGAPVPSSPFAGVLSPEPYNPLARSALAKSVQAELLLQELHRLDGVPEFLGSGIYALYFHGQHELYRPISGSERPIYVGKAVPSGARKGLTDATKIGNTLWSRIYEHRQSTEQAHDLDPVDFSVRYLVADDLFIPLAESLMIRNYRPVWNQVVDGFGNHNPGSGRYEGKMPDWDTLHPGRPWAPKLKPGKFTHAELVARVAAHLERSLCALADKTDSQRKTLALQTHAVQG